MSLGVSDKPAPEACWVFLWTVRHHCTLDPEHRITQGKHHLVHIVSESQINSIILFQAPTHLQSVMAVTNTVDFSLLAEHGLPRGCRHQSQVLLQKKKNEMETFLILVSKRWVFLCLCCAQRCVTCCVCVYLQTDCLRYFLHQAIIDDAVNSFLPGDGIG